MKKLKVFAVVFLFATIASAAPFEIYSSYVAFVTTLCGTPVKADADYRKTAAAGWGWKMDTNSPVHTASAGTNAMISWIDRLGASGCGVSPLTIPVTPNAVRFIIWWPTANGSTPTGTVTNTLTGFLP